MVTSLLAISAVALVTVPAHARFLVSYALHDVIACPSQSSAKALLGKFDLDHAKPTEAQAVEGHCYLVPENTTTAVETTAVVAGQPVPMQWAGPFRRQHMWAATTNPEVFDGWGRDDLYPNPDMHGWE